MGQGPLSGVRVLDLTQFLAGPFGTMILGDLGAEVLKIESPDGDMTRGLPPHFIDGDSAYYLSANRNKKSVVVDLKDKRGQEIVRELVSQSDIVMENFRPGVTSRLGLDRAELCSADESLIWCSISGFGQTGPYSHHPAYDMVVQALAGGMSMTGEPGGPAVRSGLPISDLNAGMFGVIGVLSALHERNRTGRGQFVDISMLDGQISMLSYQAMYTLISGAAPGRQGRGHESIPTYRTFDALGGTEIVVTANTERMWLGLCRVLSLEDLVDDPRFVTNRDRYTNRDVLWPILEPRFKTKEASEWLRLFRDAGVPAAVVNSVLEALNDPQVVERDMVVSIDSPQAVPVKFIGNPVKVEHGLDTDDYVYPPKLGEDTREVLRDLLHLDDDAIRALEDQGIVGRAADATV